MKKIKGLFFICLVLFLTSGCSSNTRTTTDGKEMSDEWTKVGRNIGIEVPKQLTLSEENDVLAGDGLYYATWVTGNSVPYKNSDGDTVDLYDAQLYFLANEANDEAGAKESYDTWLASARENYQIKEEKQITCNGQAYTMITYDCIGEDNPYDRGVSAFGTCGVNAVCAEFTCVKDYKEDLEAILTELLDGCHYKAE